MLTANTMKKIYLTAITLLFIAACGNKGPLYLPDTGEKAETTEEKKAATTK